MYSAVVLVVVAVALYMMGPWVHSPLRGQLDFILQLQDLVVCAAIWGCIILALWLVIMVFMFGEQLYESLTLFLLMIDLSRWWEGKCLSRRQRNFFPMFVVQAEFQGGLNHIMFLCLDRLVGFSLVGVNSKFGL